VAVVGTGAAFRVEVAGQTKTISLDPPTGGWQVWKTISTPGISLTAGRHVIRISLASVATSGGGGNYNWLRLVDTTPSSPTTP
jgi:hypothetical protein